MCSILTAALTLTLTISGVDSGESKTRLHGSEPEPLACFRGDLQHTGVYQTTGPHQQATILWRMRTDGLIRSSPLLVGTVLYVGSGDGFMRSVDAGSGEERWRFKTGGAVASSPAFARGVVYFTSRDRCLYAVAADNGTLRWRFPMADDLPYRFGFDYYLSSPIVVGDRVYAGGGDGCLYAVSAASGRQIWKFQTRGRIQSSPAYAEGMILVGSMDGHLYALDAQRGGEIWKFATAGVKFNAEKRGYDPTSVISSAAIADSTVFFGGRDGYLYAVDLKTGKRRWRYSHKGSWVISSPALVGQLVIVGSGDGQFIQAVDRTTGVQKWRVKTTADVFSSGTVAQDAVYFGDQDGWIHALAWATGKLLWRYRLDGPVDSTIAVADGRMYVGCNDGCLYALEHQVPAIQARGPAKKAVFWDPERKWKFLTADTLVKDYLADQGYEILGPASLRPFLAERAKDQAPSVIVFATDHLPDDFAQETQIDTLRNYLLQGGKVVWLGAPPLIWEYDRVTGQPKAFARKNTEHLLGVPHPYTRADFYGFKITPEGYRWGLRNQTQSSWGVDPHDVDLVLAIDESGKATSWVRTFNKGITGAGFVQLWGFPSSLPNLKEIQTAAEYGLR
jgi:outer membrane protein assembly factor BamB